MSRWWKSNGTRYERDARARRDRAHALRSRIQNTMRRNAERRRLSTSARRALLAVAFVASLSAGAMTGVPLVESVTHRWRDEPNTVVSISVQGHRELSAAGVAEATGIDRGGDIGDLDLATVVARLADHPWIRSSAATRLPGGQLVIQIVERVPAAVLLPDSTGALSEGGYWNLVDTTGTPFARMSTAIPEGLPLLRSSQPLELDEPHPDLATALELSENIAKLGIERLAGRVELVLPDEESNRGWSLNLVTRQKDVVLGSHEPDVRLSRLQELLGAGLGEVQRADHIDLRFAGRAVLSGGSVSN